jgi:hypothetical protein
MCCSPNAAASRSEETDCVEEKGLDEICVVERETAGATARRADVDPLLIIAVV